MRGSSDNSDGPMRAGDNAMTMREPDEIVLAPGHAITRSGRRAKQKVLEEIPMCDVLRGWR